MKEIDFKEIDKFPILRAGVAKCEISTHAPGIKVNDPLYAKALVFDDSSVKIVIVEMDAVAIGSIYGIGDDFLEKLRLRIERILGIDGHNVLVSASHTHTVGPMLCEAEELLDKTFDAVSVACQDMTEVKIGSGLGYEDRIMINRTLRLKNGQHWSIRSANPCPPDNEVESLGPVDPDIGILRIDRLNGQPLAVVYSFSCHALLGVPDGSVTANFPGFASKVIEDNFDAMALFLQGNCGDVVELLFKDFNRPSDSEPVGTILGLSTLKALRSIKPGKATINVVCKTIELPRRTDIPRRIKDLKREQTDLLKSLFCTTLNFKTFLPLYIKYILNPDFPSEYSYRYLHTQQIGSKALLDMDAKNRENIDKYLNSIYIMEKLARIQVNIVTLEHYLQMNRDSGEKTVKAEVQGIRIGDFVLITAPAEILVEVGLNIKRLSPYKHTFIVSPSNGYLNYGAPESYYDKGGYEVVECMLGSGWQRLYEEKVAEIIRLL